MEKDNRRFFMLDPETNRHHTNPHGLWRHFPNTCNTYEIRKKEVLHVNEDPRKTSFGLSTEIRIVPTSNGFVTVLYFNEKEESHIVFVAQIGPNRSAWQNISWQAGFHLNWDENLVEKAVNNFLWVAECEEAKQHLPKKSYTYTKIP